MFRPFRAAKWWINSYQNDYGLDNNTYPWPRADKTCSNGNGNISPISISFFLHPYTHNNDAALLCCPLLLLMNLMTIWHIPLHKHLQSDDKCTPSWPHIGSNSQITSPCSNNPTTLNTTTILAVWTSYISWFLNSKSVSTVESLLFTEIMFSFCCLLLCTLLPSSTLVGSCDGSLTYL